MTTGNADPLTATVLAAMDATPDPRRREITAALVWHLHNEPHPLHADVVAPWYSLRHTLVLAPGRAELPRPPIG